MPGTRRREFDTRPNPSCAVCDGKKTIIHIEKGKITCPECKGTGKAK